MKTYFDLEEISSPLTVTGCQYRSVDIDESIVPEELVNGSCGSVPDPEHG